MEVTLSQYHPRRQPWTERLFGQMDLRSSFNIYRDRFADASDFTFVIVGNITPEQLRPYVLQYLGSLPALRRNEHWRDIGARPPKGVIQKTVHKGIEQKSQVEIVFTGPFDWSQANRYTLNSLSSALEIRLREILREEKGGTYGVSVSGSTEQYPVPAYSFRIAFSCAPERVEELSKSMFAEIERFKEAGVDESYVLKVKETQRRERETDLKTNGFWLSYLRFYYQNGEDPENINRYDALVAKLTAGALQDAARRYLDMKNYVDVVLYPAK
jgi:zinc protease